MMEVKELLPQPSRSGGRCLSTFSLYHQFNDQHVFTVALSILMTGTLILGLLRRETFGVGRIGSESLALLVLYAAGVAVLLG
jgi:cation:H+ antiporter